MEAQYTIYLPEKDSEGNELPWLLTKIRKSLTAAGLHGRTVVRGESDGVSQTDPTTLLMITLPDEPKSDAIIHGIALSVKQIARTEGVVVTKQPITTWVVSGPGEAPSAQPVAKMDDEYRVLYEDDQVVTTFRAKTPVEAWKKLQNWSVNQGYSLEDVVLIDSDGAYVDEPRT